VSTNKDYLKTELDPELDIEYECVEEKDLNEYVVKWFYD
jgi:hypothetical protein